MGPKIIILNEDQTMRAVECHISKYLSKDPDGPITHILTWWRSDMWDEDSGEHHVIPIELILYDRKDADEVKEKTTQPEIVPYRIGIPETLRNEIYERDGYKCVKCGNTDRLAIDHIHPWSKGGKTEYNNLQTLCKSCNSKKGAKHEA